MLAEAFVAEEDASFEAVLKKVAKSEPAAKKRKTGGSTAKKGKRRAHHSSDDEDSEDDAADAEDMELSEDEAAAIKPKPKPSRRRGGGGVADAKDSGASAAEELSAAALATVRDLMLRERRDAEAFAELRLRLNLGSLDLKLRKVTNEVFYRSTPQYKALLEKLSGPLPDAAATRGAAAAGAITASALGAVAAQDILSGIAERKEIIGAVTAAKLQELAASGRTDAVIARLLECSAAEAAAVFDHLRIHDIKVIEELILHGSVALPATSSTTQPRTMEQLDDTVAMLVQHLHLKLRKGGA